MKKLFTLLSFILLINLLLFSQEQVYLEIFLSDISNETVRIHNSIQLSDGGYALAGRRYNENNKADFFLAKIDENMDHLWAKYYKSTSSDAYAEYITELNDGGFLLGGVYHNGFSVMKINEFGSAIWGYRYGSGNCNKIIETSKGDYLAIGHFRNTQDIYVVRINTDGSINWAYVYGNGEGYDIHEKDSNSFIICGQHEAGAYVAEIDSLGNKKWSKSFSSDLTVIRDALYTDENEYYFTGYVSGSFNPVGLIKLNSSANPMWYKEYGVGSNCQNRKIEITSDGGVLMSGFWPWSGGAHMYLLKTDSLGNAEWCNRYPDAAAGNTSAYDDAITLNSVIIDDSTVVVGGGSWGIYLYKANLNGNLNCNIYSQIFYEEEDSITVAIPNDTVYEPDNFFASTVLYSENTILSKEYICCKYSPSASFYADVDDLSVYFVDSSTYATTWSWDFGDGDGSNDETPIHVYDSAGIYEVSLIVSNQCGDVDSINKIVSVPGCINIKGIIKNQKCFYTVYPNPLSNILNINLHSGVDKISLKLINLNGQIIRSNTYTNTESIQMNIESLPQGFYILSIETKDIISKHKIIKE